MLLGFSFCVSELYLYTARALAQGRDAREKKQVETSARFEVNTKDKKRSLNRALGVGVEIHNYVLCSYKESLTNQAHCRVMSQPSL